MERMEGIRGAPPELGTWLSTSTEFSDVDEVSEASVGSSLAPDELVGEVILCAVTYIVGIGGRVVYGSSSVGCVWRINL